MILIEMIMDFVIVQIFEVSHRLSFLVYKIANVYSFKVLKIVYFENDIKNWKYESVDR
jgi:hypothetical protein